MSEKSVIPLEEISASPADTELVVGAAVSTFHFDAPEEKAAGEKGEKSPPVGCPELPVEDMCEAEVGTEADVEDEDVDVCGGVDEVGVSGYQSEGFTLSEN